MKICQVLGSRGFAGLERHVVELCNHLADRGHEVILVADQEFSRYLDARVRLEPLDLSGWRYNPVTLVLLLRALRRIKADIVHAQANKAAAMFGVIAGMVPGIHVATLHSLKSNTSMFNHYDHVIAVSNSAAKSIAHDRVSVIYNGIQSFGNASDQGRTELAKLPGVNLDHPVVLTAGRLVKVKGFDILIRAWNGINADLLIAGEGPEKAALQSLVQESGLQDTVHFLGQRDDVPVLMQGADLIVISSRREGFSYVMAEGLHARRLVVSTRVPGPMDLLPEAVLVPCEDADALHARIHAVLENPQKFIPLFEPVWEFATRELTLDAMVQKTEALYARLLNETGAGNIR